MTILVGYNTPIIEALQGSTQAPYLDSRRAVLQKQARDLGDRTAGRNDIIHNNDMESFNRQFKPEGVFQVPSAQPGAQMMLNGRCAHPTDGAGFILTTKPARQASGEQIALVITAAPGAAAMQRHANNPVCRRQSCRSPFL
ncbi:hypothetical protein GCM10011513_30370 [Franconibacter daqui]|nr:hypothetical protein GCM10011513_30370 [Franconibacter daqui]